MTDTTLTHILLVDDSPHNLVALEAALAPLGRQLLLATSGEEALRMLLHREISLIVMDVQMPGLDGLATAALIKRRERTRHVPIILLTASGGDVAEVARGYAHGAVDYLHKPCDPEVLRTKVAALIGLHRQAQCRHAGLERCGGTPAHGAPEHDTSATRDAFLTFASHELRTPLAAAKLQLQLALRRLAGGSTLELEHSLRAMERQVDRLTHLVEDLLDVSLLYAGRLELERQPVELVSLARGALAHARERSAQHHFRLRAPPSLWTRVDPRRAEQLLAHLLHNATRFSPLGGEVEVGLEPVLRGAHLWVRDQGVGVPPERQRDIFERFTRAHPSSGGLGLGLTLCQGIVDRHGGHIWVESSGRPGEGSTFHVHLPGEGAAARAAPPSLAEVHPGEA